MRSTVTSAVRAMPEDSVVSVAMAAAAVSGANDAADHPVATGSHSTNLLSAVKADVGMIAEARGVTVATGGISGAGMIAIAVLASKHLQW